MHTQPQSYSCGPYIISAALLGFTCLAAFLHYNDERRAIPKGQGTKPGDVKGPIIGGPFSLVDTDGHVVTERDLLGKWVLLYFGYTLSPDVGPDQLQVMAQAIDFFDTEKQLDILPVFVSIDPQRDTPAHLRAYLKEFDPRIVGLTGPLGNVRRMAQQYRVFFRKFQEDGDDYLIETSHNMYLINPNMEIVRCIGAEYDAKEVVKTMRDEMTRG